MSRGGVFFVRLCSLTPLCIYFVSMYVCYTKRWIDRLIKDQRREGKDGKVLVLVLLGWLRAKGKRKRFLWDFIGVVAS